MGSEGTRPGERTGTVAKTEPVGLAVAKTEPLVRTVPKTQVLGLPIARTEPLPMVAKTELLVQLQPLAVEPAPPSPVDDLDRPPGTTVLSSTRLLWAVVAASLALGGGAVYAVTQSFGSGTSQRRQAAEQAGPRVDPSIQEATAVRADPPAVSPNQASQAGDSASGEIVPEPQPEPSAVRSPRRRSRSRVGTPLTQPVSAPPDDQTTPLPAAVFR